MECDKDSVTLYGANENKMMFKPGKILGSFDTAKNEIKWRKTVTHTHNSKTSQFWTRLDNKYGMNYVIYHTSNAKNILHTNTKISLLKKDLIQI